MKKRTWKEPAEKDVTYRDKNDIRFFAKNNAGEKTAEQKDIFEVLRKKNYTHNSIPNKNIFQNQMK